jgi:hypothetical protein
MFRGFWSVLVIAFYFVLMHWILPRSADGLGQLAAKCTDRQGHKVVVHARNEQRGLEALDKVPGAETVVTANLSSVGEQNS